MNVPLPKKHFNKKGAHKFLFFNGKKIRMIRIIFDIKTLLLMTDFDTSQQGGKAKQSIPGRL